MRNLKVFVYGTLREGEGNHRLLGNDAVKIANGNIVGKLWLNFGLPMITASENDDDRVTGEVWELADINRLADVDMLEGHPTWYQRHQVPVHITDGEIPYTILSWAYFVPEAFITRDGCQRVLNGDYVNPEMEAA